MTHSSAATAAGDPDSAPSPITALSAVAARPSRDNGAMATWLAERRVTASGETLDDVMGLTAAKREVQSLIARLRYPNRIREAGGEFPRAVLFYGPAGTG